MRMEPSLVAEQNDFMNIANSMSKDKSTLEFPENDSSMADALKKATKLKLLFVTETKQWFNWDGMVWKRDTSDGADIREGIRDFISKWIVRKDEEGLKNSFLNSNRIRNIAAALADKLRVPISKLDSQEHLVTLTNGTLNLNTGELEDFNPEHVITKKLNFAYDPGLVGGAWKNFVQQVLPDADYRRAAQSLLGYSIFVEGNPARKLVFFVGPTSTGKSTILEAISTALSPFCRTFGLPMFRDKHGEGPRQDVIDSLPYRMIYCSEATSGFEWHSDSIKRMTGEDTITARGMYAKETIARRPSFTPIIATNDMPNIKNADPALRRRLIAVPFLNQVKVEGEILGLSQQLGRNNAAEIFNWLLEGYRDFKQNSLTFADKVLKVSSDDAYVNAAGSVYMHFMNEALIPHPGEGVANSALHEAFKLWCEEIGHKENVSSVQLGRELGKLGWESGRKKVDGKTVVWRTGYTIREEYTLDYQILKLRGVKKTS